MNEVAATVAITQYEKAVASSREQRRLLRAALIEIENNRYLLRARSLEPDGAESNGSELERREGLRAVARQLKTEALQALLWSGHTDAQLLDELHSARNASMPGGSLNVEDVDAEARAKKKSLSARLVWLYRKIETTRALAEAFDDQESVPGLRNIRFRTRLKNIDEASRGIAEDANDVLKMRALDRWDAWVRVMFTRLRDFMGDVSTRLWHGRPEEASVVDTTGQ